MKLKFCILFYTTHHQQLNSNNKTNVDAAAALFVKAATANWVAAGASPAVNAPNNPALMTEIVSQCASAISRTYFKIK